MGISALPPVLYSSKVCPKASIPWQMRTVNGSFSMLSTVEDAYDVLRVSSYSRRGALNTPQAKPTQSHQRQHGLQHTLARYRPRCSARVVRAQTSANKKPTVPPCQPSFPIEHATRPSCSLGERTPSHHAALRLGVVRSRAPGQAEREPRVSLIWERPAAQTESS